MQIARVDLQSPTAAQDFAQSLRETGFAVLTNHGIPAEVITQTYEDWRLFFDSPSKYEYLYETNKQTGYFPFRSENAKNHKVKDLKEFFHLYTTKQIPNGMTMSTDAMMIQLKTLGSHLLVWLNQQTPKEISLALSEPLQQMVAGSERTLFRVLHYPPVEGTVEDGAVRAAAHEDINLITLLPAATAPGLQVKDLAGNWIDVPVNPGEIVVNAGDMLQLATKGYYKSTTHQVVNPSGDDARVSRYSMPIFIHPRPDVYLNEGKTAEAYLNERLKELGLK